MVEHELKPILQRIADALDRLAPPLSKEHSLDDADAFVWHSNPEMLEVFNNLFYSTAEQMGIVLRNTAQSINVKERLDFSCALFNNSGELIANAIVFFTLFNDNE